MMLMCDMMLMSKHCGSIYFRYKTTILAFTLSVTVMLLLTDFEVFSFKKLGFFTTHFYSPARNSVYNILRLLLLLSTQNRLKLLIINDHKSAFD